MKWLLLICLVSSFSSNAQIITTFAGGGTITPGDGGPATVARLDNPNGGVFDKYGNYYFASISGHRVRKINGSGIITTVAGNGASGFSGDGGAATLAQLKSPEGVAVDSSGNIFISDAGNSRIRKVNATTGIITTIAGSLVSGYSGDSGPAINAQLNNPLDICLDRSGNLFIADFGNGRVRKVDVSNNITTIAGNGLSGYSGDGNLATASSVGGVQGIAVDRFNNVYLASVTNSRVLKINSSGILSTVAGTGTGYLFNGDNIPATDANIDPIKVTTDGYGNVYIAEHQNYRVRMVDDDGIISTVAGDGFNGFAGDGGPATGAKLSYPSGVIIDTCGNIFVAEVNNDRVRKITYPHCHYLAIDHAVFSRDVSVYPNPVFDQLYINNVKSRSAYRLLSVAGSVSQKGVLKAGDNRIYLNSLLQGVYLLELTDDSGHRQIKKMIKL